MTRAGKKKPVSKKWEYHLVLADGSWVKDTVQGFKDSYRLKKALKRSYADCTIVSVREIPR